MNVTVSPGEQQFPSSDSITYSLGSDAAEAGDAVTISASSGDLVLTDGTNGFAGILGTQTEAGDPDRAEGVGSGSSVTLQVQGLVPANVEAAVGASVSAGEVLEAGANGTLTNIDSGDGTPEQAGPGDLQAFTDESDGLALVKIP